MEIKRFSAATAALILFASVCTLSAQTKSDGMLAPPAGSSNQLVQGYEAFKNADWTSATFFLRKAVTVPANSTAETWYMLVMSQMYSGDYTSVVADCDTFLSLFNASDLEPYIMYQKGRALHYLGQNEDSVLVLSDFCHQNPDNEMYPSALFWIAECFYADYNFDTARTMYERIVTDYPSDAKAPEAEHRLETISQREREQKLLYLLKMTSEEYLNARELYERQLKQYQTEDTLNLRKQLKAANARISELESAASETLAAARKATKASPGEDPDVVALKTKAAQLQKLIDQKYGAAK